MSKRPKMQLTEDQQQAIDETMAEMAPGYHHLIEGPAGSGKTTSIEGLARKALDKRMSIVCTAPTHKAVRVLRRKLDAAGLKSVPTRTIQSLMSLRPRQVADRQIFTRNKYAKPVLENIVVLDECSMESTDLHDNHIRKWLVASYVVFTGDIAQLNPIGEDVSPSFKTKSRSQLRTIMRQAEGNPVLAAALAVRAQQGTGKMDWSWAKEVDARPAGVFRPSEDRLKAWMHKAFTSPAFEADPDTFRYIAWRHAQVDQVNAAIRRWRYGDEAAKKTPYVIGESATFLEPLMKGDSMAFITGQEAKITAIQEGEFLFNIDQRGDLDGWVASFPSWHMKALDEFGDEIEIHAPRGEIGQDAYQGILNQLADDARHNRDRWEDFHKFKDHVAKLRPIYGMTVHASQGSTFKNVFLDIGDIGARASSNVLECQRLLYTGLTRPSHAAILRGR